MDKNPSYAKQLIEQKWKNKVLKHRILLPKQSTSNMQSCMVINNNELYLHGNHITITEAGREREVRI